MPVLDLNAEVYLPSSSDEFGTPDTLYAQLDQEFRFKLDAAASALNCKHVNYYTKEDDALSQDWAQWRSVFCNPPYSRGNLLAFTAKAYEESRKGATIVMVVPACTDTRWFHDNVVGKAEIRYVRGRQRFKGGKSSARFPTLVLVYRPIGPN